MSYDFDFTRLDFSPKFEADGLENIFVSVQKHQSIIRKKHSDMSSTRHILINPQIQPKPKIIQENRTLYIEITELLFYYIYVLLYT